MEKFRYGKVPFDFAYTYDDLETVTKYEAAEIELTIGLTDIEKLPMKERIKTVSKVLTKFVYDVLGETAVKKVLGDNPKITKLIEFKNTLILYVTNRMKAENSAVLK
ncbi:MAG: hypothetical protein LBU77_05040 [Clostridiales bacterium]|jgi:hypothetical protein|nr:hypothetical protein [Clostridiales bacterium]